ncbi:MAG: bifunctional metallophosphatase/5'-nucleotidase [Thermodesulfobacteriota bacterium]
MKKTWIVFIAVLLSVGLTFWAEASPVNLRILYVNDFHGFAAPIKPTGGKAPQGGIAYLAGAADQARQQQPSLLLAAGDMIQGGPWANMFKGKSVIEVMNAMKFDAMVVGNHEFNFGLEALKDRIAQANFPILGANVEGFPGLKPYVIKKINGIRIGIIGVVTEDTVHQNPRNVAGLNFTSPESAIHKYLPELKRQADIIVVLSHCGYPVDRKLAATITGIEVIVGGHTHTKLLHPEKIGDTIIVQAWEHAKVLGILDLKVENGKIVGFEGALQEISPVTGKPDPQIQEIVAHYEGLANPPLKQIIGEALIDLDASQVRLEETNLGNFIADVMRQTTGADVAIINSGGIKGSIPKGKIELQDVYAALPYDNYLIAVKLTGAQLKEALEHGVSRVEKPSHRFPQVSGLTFTYSPSAPAGSRVKDAAIGGRPLDLGKDYVVATIDYLASGGDGYKVFGDALKSQGGLKGDKLVYNDVSSGLRDRVIDAIKARKNLAPGVEGRIKAVD